MGQQRLGIQQRQQPLAEGRALQGEAGEVGGDAGLPRPARRGADGRQHRPVQLLGQARRFGEGDEFLHAADRQLGIRLRPQQRLEMVRGAVGERDDGLEGQAEAALGDGAAQPDGAGIGFAHEAGQAIGEAGLVQRLRPVAGEAGEGMAERAGGLHGRQPLGRQRQAAGGDRGAGAATEAIRAPSSSRSGVAAEISP